MKIKDLKILFDRLIERIRYSTLANLMRKIPFPASGGVPLTEVIKVFYLKMTKEAVGQRAGSISFSFFLALFPGLIFIFTLIPYVPVPNLAEEVKHLMEEFLPYSAFDMLWKTIEDIIVVKRTRLLSIGVIMAIYFSSNGINSLLTALKKDLARHWLMRYIVAFMLTVALVFLILIAMSVQITGSVIIGYFSNSFFFSSGTVIPFVWWFKLAITFLTAISAISLIYFYGSAKGERFGFFSPGAFLATIMIGVISYGFGFYVENFNSYNKFYGSLGAIIALMIWLNFSAISLISGYELNQSIFKAKKNNSTNSSVHTSNSHK